MPGPAQAGISGPEPRARLLPCNAGLQGRHRLAIPAGTGQSSGLFRAARSEISEQGMLCKLPEQTMEHNLRQEFSF